MDGDVGDSNNCDGVDDGVVVNINCSYDPSCDDCESIVDFGDQKDGDGDGYSVDDGTVATYGGIDPGFGVDKII